MFRPTVLTTSLSAVEHNFRIVRAFCQDRTRYIAVVKADAYGHGMVPVAKRLLACGATALAVATVDEALTLRDSGITSPVLVLGGTPESAFEEAVRQGVSLAVYDAETLKALSRTAEKADRPALAHLKLDTGMSRIGVRTDEALSALLDVWQNCPRVTMEGAFSHFAAADSDPEFTALQKARFDSGCRMIAERGYKPIRHIAASTGIALGAPCFYDAVRPGIVLYGAEVNRLFPDIVPAQTLTARPTRDEWIDAGDTVGYGRTFRAARRTRLLTLPIGYGDGYPRALSNKADVLIEGKRARIVGRVCMDQLMIDVTDIPEATLNSEAVLLGAQGKERITPDELARLSDTIPYEIMLGFTSRVERRIVE